MTLRALAVVPLLAVVGSLVGSLAGCGGPPEVDGERVEVTVRFSDRTVAPEFHRSWQVTLDADSLSMTVDSYGETLAERELPMDDARWARYVEDLPAALEDIGSDDAGTACPGGASITLTVEDGGEDADRQVRSAECGDDEASARAAAAIEDLVAPFRDDLGLDAAISVD